MNEFKVELIYEGLLIINFLFNLDFIKLFGLLFGFFLVVLVLSFLIFFLSVVILVVWFCCCWSL